ncbi:MAG TPA: hypothetical protein PLI94_10530 [Bacillota bacterium]|nr:hypothetical protein [Bacillota bacterium]HPT68456.1 hypothetical protein [Bacillota bacterium]
MKSTFYKDVEETFGVELKKNGFRLAPLISNGEYCVYVKRYDKNIGMYVICDDNRPKGGDVSVTLRFAPIQIPDDGIEKLNIGIRILI